MVDLGQYTKEGVEAGEKLEVGRVYSLNDNMLTYLGGIYDSAEDYLENGYYDRQTKSYGVKEMNRDLEHFQNMPSGKKDYRLAQFFDLEGKSGRLPIVIWLEPDGSMPEEFYIYHKMQQYDCKMRDFLWWI